MANELSSVRSSKVSGAAYLEHLDTEQLVNVRVLVSECRATAARIQQDFIYMSVHLGSLHKILGKDAFFPFVEQELDIAPYQARRFLLMNTSMTQHLSTDEGKVDVKLVNNFTQAALKILAPVTDEAVIEEVRALAKRGESINEKVIRELIDSHKNDFEARIASAESELESVQRLAREADLKRELEASRLQGQITGSTERIRRLTEQAEELEQEVAKLKEAPTIVTENKVEVLPEGFLSVEAAIDEANKRLAETQRQIKETQIESADLVAKRDLLHKTVADFTAANQDFLEVKTQIDSILLKFPQAKLRAISEDPSQRNAISLMGAAMVDLGNQLRSATQ